jgi:DNA-binding CsgD family transcriptional regulator
MTASPVTIEASLLELLGDVIGLLELDEFRAGLLRVLRAAVPADWISLNDLASDPQSTVVLIEPSFPPEAHELYARHAYENPLVARYQRTLDGRAYRFSDVGTPQQLHATALYQEFYAPIGLEHQIAFTLPHAPERLLAIALSRRDHDFTEAERELLDRARPFLIQSYRNAIEYTRLQTELKLRKRGSQLPLEHPRLAVALAKSGVTRREAEVLSFVATGLSDRQVAAVLGVSERTVQTHLRRCYIKLQVHTRTEAVALARTLAGGSPRRRRR